MSGRKIKEEVHSLWLSGHLYFNHNRFGLYFQIIQTAIINHAREQQLYLSIHGRKNTRPDWVNFSLYLGTNFN